MGETHLKLCKKVAQLTKVIYHLNTRNEDNDLRVQELRTHHDAELATVVKDAQAKIGAAQKEAGESRATLTKQVEKRLDELAKAHEREKKKALAQLQEAKQKLEKQTAAAAKAETAGLAKLRSAEGDLKVSAHLPPPRAN